MIGKNLIFLGALMLLMALPANAAWYNSSWLNRTNFTIQSSQVLEDVANPAVRINLADAVNLSWNCMDANGSDLIAVASDQATKLPRELINFSRTAHTGILFTSPPNLSASTNTVISVYSCNANATEVNSPSVWSDRFMAVWHLEEKGNETKRDSTKNGYNITDVLGFLPGDATAGKVGGGLKFYNNGSGTILTTASPSTTELTANISNLMVSAWVNPVAFASQCIFYSYVSADRLYICTDGASPNHWLIGAGAGSLATQHTVDSGSWQFLVARYQGQNASLYKNSIYPTARKTYANFTVGQTLRLGASATYTDSFKGTMDEVWIQTAQNESYMNMTFNMLNNSLVFYTPGDTENQFPTFASPTYANIAVSPPSPRTDNTSLENVTFSVTARDASALANVTVIINGTRYLNATSAAEFNLTKTVELGCGDTTYQFDIFNAAGLENLTPQFTWSHTCDFIAPTVALYQPTGYFNSTPVPLNFLAFDAIAMDRCWYQIDSDPLVYTGCGANTTIAAVEGTHIIYFYGNDTAGNVNQSYQMFAVDTTGPSFAAISTVPDSPHFDNQTAPHPVLFNLTALDNIALQSITFDLNGVDHNTSISGTEYNFSQSFDVLCGVSTFHWHIFDMAQNTVATTQFSFIHDCDTAAPFILISQPSGNYANLTVPLEFTAFNNISMDSCWYQLDLSGNIPIANCLNTSITTTEGYHDIYLYGNDSVGNINVSYSNFVTDITPPVMAISSPSGNQFFPETQAIYTVDVSFTAVDSGVNNVTCSYILNGGNLTAIPCASFSVTIATKDQLNTLAIYGSDSLGNTASDSTTFTVKVSLVGTLLTHSILGLFPILLAVGLVIFGIYSMSQSKNAEDMAKSAWIMIAGIAVLIVIGSLLA